MEHPVTWRDDGKLVDAAGMVFAPDAQGMKDLVSLLSARIALLTPVAEYVIECAETENIESIIWTWEEAVEAARKAIVKAT